MLPDPDQISQPKRSPAERLPAYVEAVNALESQFEALDDVALRAKTDEFRQRLTQAPRSTT